MRYKSKGFGGLYPMSPGFQQHLDRMQVRAEIKEKKAEGEDTVQLEAKLAGMPGVD